MFFFRASLVAASVKNLPAVQVDLGSIPGLGWSPGGGHGNPLRYSCLENPHGQKSLAGYSPWGLKESDMTEWQSTAQHILKRHMVIFDILLKLDMKGSCTNTLFGSFFHPRCFLLPCCCCLVASVTSDSVRPHGLQPARLFCPWGFSRQEYWSGLPCPPPGDLPHPGIEPVSLVSPAVADEFFTTSATWEAPEQTRMEHLI